MKTRNRPRRIKPRRRDKVEPAAKRAGLVDDLIAELDDGSWIL
jgi:hypothetical protein